MHRLRLMAILTALAVLAAACGARLSDEEIATGDRLQGIGGGGAATGAETTTGGDTAGTTTGEDAAATTTGGDTAGTTAGGDTAGGDTTGGATTGGATTGGPTTGGPAPTVPPGGNGGATDVGVTATELTIGNVSTQTGPVPGLFKGALTGIQAFVAYQNSLGGVFGRKLKVKPGDDRLDGGANRSTTAALAKETFALVGSFSVTDEGGADVVQSTGIPDIGFALSRKRQSLPNQFSIQPLPPGWRLGSLNYFKEKYGQDVITNVAGFYGDVPASKDAYNGQKAAAQSVGYKYDFDQPLQPTETNYTPYVIRMQSEGSKALFMAFDATGMARMAKAIQGQGYNDELALANYGANAYDKKFLDLAGSAADGAIIDMQLAMYLGEDRASVPEIDLFLTWMNKIAPGVSPDIFAAYSWASGRLFVQALQAAGPKATRAGLLDALKKIDNFDANGMLAPAGPASKRPPTCFMVVKVQGGKFVRDAPAGKGFICDKGDYFRL